MWHGAAISASQNEDGGASIAKCSGMSIDFAFEGMAMGSRRLRGVVGREESLPSGHASGALPRGESSGEQKESFGENAGI